MPALSTDRDRDMILHPRKWPLVVLPLKRRNPFSEGNTAVFAPSLRVMDIEPNARIEIRIGTMFDKLSELPTKEYENVDALLADGWMVD